MNEIYRRYSSYLKEKYGEKVYKLPVSIPVSCPNRQEGGTGCAYCGGAGAGFETLSGAFSVREQLAANRQYIGSRYKAKKFIAYFQSFTNTYLPLDQFRQYMEEAIGENIVELSVSTRPDCVRREYLDVLSALRETFGVDITLELGLQTANYHTLERVNRGHTLAEYIEAALLIKQYGFSLCTHVILNLPWDDRLDAIETAKLVSVMKTDFVKLHALYIEKGTEMARLYESGQINICSVEEYEERVMVFLRYLSPQCWIQRLIGRAPEEAVLFANWQESWWKIQERIERKMAEAGFCQGDLYHYLGGKAVKKFFN